METIHLSSDTPKPSPCVATIGFFDGVHLGHRYLIRRVEAVAQAASMVSTVVTFAAHPREVLDSSYVPRLLTTCDEKLRLLSATGLGRIVILPFDKSMAALSAREFMATVLLGRLNVRKLVIGYDNRFGHNREEGFDDYCRYGRELGIEVIRSNPFTVGGLHISSSLIRRLLLDGRVSEAAQYLCRPHTVGGTVVSGYREGRRLGFPTANLKPDDGRILIPAKGVYASKTSVEGLFSDRLSMTCVGTRPTFGGTAVTIETYIPDFDGDLYGRRMSVAFCRWVRGERKFDSPEELKEQLRRDEQTIKNIFSKD